MNIPIMLAYAGIVYDLTDIYSLYGSYTSIFTPDGFRDVNRNFLPPTEGPFMVTSIPTRSAKGGI
jgi:outer membrane receptor for ferric coprogen and ferric-rhodotorulic acid